MKKFYTENISDAVKYQNALNRNTQEMVVMQKRYFGLNQSPNENDTNKKGGMEYESSFDDLLKEGAVSEEQRKNFEKRREEKA